MPNLISYLNPCSKDFHSINEFKSLRKKKNKAEAILITIVSGVFTFGIAAVPVFRLLVGRFKKAEAKKLSPTDKKIKATSDGIKPPKEEKKLLTEETIQKEFEAVKKDLAGKEFPSWRDGVKEAMRLLADRLGKRVGTAIDNGDCFFDAFAQGLGKDSTVKTLRAEVEDYVKTLYQDTLCLNWVYEAFLKNELKENSDRERQAQKAFKEYREKIGKDFEECKPNPPIWGNQALDGLILSEKHCVNLQVIEVGLRDDGLGKVKFDPQKLYFALETYPKKENYDKNVVLGLYPGHFVPILECTQKY